MFKPALAIALLLSATQAQAACPVINGIFEQVAGDTTITMGLHTELKDGKYFYNFDVDKEGPFFEADGILKDYTGGGQTGKLRVSCDETSVTFEGKADGQDFKVRTEVVSQDKIRQSGLGDQVLELTRKK